ncbi:MAG: hypothetical protein V3T05_08450 [Myxococcota bacterium]
MTRAAYLFFLIACTACRGDPLGRPCDVDDECGPGFDCFSAICVQLCTTDDECREGQTCYRYHCVIPGQEHVRRSRPIKLTTSPATAPPRPPAASRPAPPVPDATAAELRALRRELELMRREQAKLAEAIRAWSEKHPAPAP